MQIVIPNFPATPQILYNICKKSYGKQQVSFKK